MRSARRAVDAAIAEIERLEDIFSVYRQDSELQRWKRGEVPASAELTAVLALAWSWWQRTEGAFSPAAKTPPDLPLPYRLEADEAIPSDGAETIDLNAIAKGWIVDRAIQAALRHSPEELMVNAGGDIVHRGGTPMVVHIEDPMRRGHGAPITALVLGDAAVATSGTSWRGTHVLDPRTGGRVEHIISATVVADDAASADALATALMVLPAADGTRLTDQLAPQIHGCLLVGADGSVHPSTGWPALLSAGPAR